MQTSQDALAALSSPARHFVEELTQSTDGLLAKPAQLPPDFTPRRSIRLARAPAEAAKMIQQDLFDALGIKAVSKHEASEEYGRLFQKPLSASHLEALAALFGWHLPERVEGSRDVTVYVGPTPVED